MDIDKKDTKDKIPKKNKDSSDVLSEIIDEAVNDAKIEKKTNKKKIILFSLICLLVIILSSTCIYFFIYNKEEPTNIVANSLPLPELSGGERGKLGIDKNINESTIDRYLNRSDSVYRDMRMLEDPANYENIGGDRFLSGYIDGFEIVPLPYIIPVSDLPTEVGETYNGRTLFSKENDTYIANYDESYQILESYFPKDKYIFLMCGGGGYAGQMRRFLIALGWDENKIYNIGGYWYYNGNHSINIRKEVNGKFEYDFDSLPYHEIYFDTLSPISEYANKITELEELKFTDSKIELLENKSFYLNVVRLPAGSAYTELEYISSDSSIAEVTEFGLLISRKPGTATITVKSKENNNIKATCTVLVNAKPTYDPVKLDNINKLVDEYNEYDLYKLKDEFNNKVYDDDYTYKAGYYFITQGGWEEPNELYNKEYGNYVKKLDTAYENRLRILNNLIDNKKTFIIVQYTSICDSKPFEIYESAERILNKYNIPYIFIYNEGSKDANQGANIDLNSNNLGTSSIIIVKDGKVFEYIDSNVYSFSTDEETEEWLKDVVQIESYNEITSTIKVENEE